MNIKGHYISDKFKGQCHRSRSPGSKNVKIPVFSLVSENTVQGQGHKGQDRKGQDRKGQGCKGQRHTVKVKVVWGFLL